MQTLAKLISMLSHRISRVIANLCVGIVFVMLGLLMTQILMRYFLGSPPSWTEELAIILFAWLVLLYATVGLRERFHVAIDVIPTSWTIFHRCADKWIPLVAGGLGFVALVAGYQYVERTTGQKTAALQLPIEILYLSVPVSGALFIFHAIAQLLEPEVEHPEASTK